MLMSAHGWRGRSGQNGVWPVRHCHRSAEDTVLWLDSGAWRSRRQNRSAIAWSLESM